MHSDSTDLHRVYSLGGGCIKMPTGSFQQFIMGFALLVSCIFTGIIISWIGGMLIDGFYANSLYGQPIVPQNLIDYAQSPFYTAASNMGVELYFINLFYLLCWAISILGVLLFFQSFVRYSSVDSLASLGGQSGGNTGRQRLRRRRNR